MSSGIQYFWVKRDEGTNGILGSPRSFRIWNLKYVFWTSFKNVTKELFWKDSTLQILYENSRTFMIIFRRRFYAFQNTQLLEIRK